MTMNLFHRHIWKYRIDVDSDSFPYGAGPGGIDATAWRHCAKKGCDAHKIYWSHKTTYFIRQPTYAETVDMLKKQGFVKTTRTILEKPT